jgi:integrase
MLTEIAIQKVRPSDKRREVPDGKISGLYLIVQPSGAKSWAVRYRVAGAPKKLTVGAYPAIDLATARRKAQEALGQVAGGNDPAGEKTAAREAQKAANSPSDRLEAIVAEFVAKHLLKRAKPSWAKEAERLLRVEIVSQWGRRKLAEITRADVRRLLDDIAERAPITANRTLAVFRKLCNWAVAKELIEVSLCAGIEAPTNERERQRDRVLTDDEIRLAWAAFDRVGWPFGPIGKLLILTGARRDEVAAMRWNEVDLGARVWTLPKTRTKNKHEHAIPLSDEVASIIAGLKRIEGKEGFVFTTTGATAVSGFSRAKAAVDKAILEILASGDDPAEVKAPDPWTIHDLRRTVATNLQRMGVKLEVTEAVLNHVSGSRAGIVGVYQRHEYSDEKRGALDAWSRKLKAVVEGRREGKIVAFLRK